MLFPVSLVYGLAVIVRNYGYDAGLLTSRSFDVPVISVGNLAVGGTGKSPMTGYLYKLLHKNHKVAVLSRGYGRNTTGYIEVNTDDDADLVGDEPLQFKRNFPEATVAVCEERVKAIGNLKDHHQAILLDDAFQHRALTPGLSILLFDYESFSKTQWLLPTGNLREPVSAIKRADVIVITKTPLTADEESKEHIRTRLKTAKPVYFSHLQYADLKSIQQGHTLPLSTIKGNWQIFLLTGIANPKPLVQKLEQYTLQLRHHQYPDHHPFSLKNVGKLVADFMHAEAAHKLIITTEKDAQRLRTQTIRQILEGLPVYYLPVDAAFAPPDKANFDKLISSYVTEHTTHNRIHQT